MMFERDFQRFERHALARMRRQFQGAQTQRLKYLQRTEIRRRFQHNRIAGLGHGAQTQVDRFGAA